VWYIRVDLGGIDRALCSQNASQKARMNKKPAQRRTLWTRRDLLTRSGWAMVLGTIGVAAASSLRLLFPRVRFTPPTTVVLGRPENFSVGQLSTKWKKSHSVILVRNQEGFYALRSICTHLGCIPNYRPSEKKFKCPCHGSGFHLTGINFEGPAPRPLERLKIFFDEDGRLVVDTAVRFRQERGEWSHEGAFASFPSNGGQA